MVILRHPLCETLMNAINFVARLLPSMCGLRERSTKIKANIKRQSGSRSNCHILLLIKFITPQLIRFFCSMAGFQQKGTTV